MDRVSVRRHRTSNARRGEDGSVLVIALVVMILAMSMVAALMSYAATSVRSEKGYTARTQRVEQVQDALSFMMAAMRTPIASTNLPDGSIQPRTGLLGLDGSTTNRTYAGFAVTCTGDSGSGGLNANGTYDDRSVTCSATPSAVVYHFQLHFVDDGGTNLGQEVQVRGDDFNTH